MGWCTAAIFLISISASWALPLGSNEDTTVSKRTADPTLQLSPWGPYLPPYGIYPGIKPLRPILPPGFIINRFATPSPPISPIEEIFKSKKDEFLSKLFDQISLEPGASELEARSVTDEDPTEPTVTTPKPKVDPSIFISKKFDFLSKLFKAINSTTTPAPTIEGQTVDPLATTVKPTIVPADFWVPIFKPPKLPKPPKATKPPKPSKSNLVLLDATDKAILQGILDAMEPPSNSGKATRKASFLDALLHRATTPEPEVETTTADSSATADYSALESRSLFPPGYWIPPYIYAAKMGIYLDKIFDSINSAAQEDISTDNSLKRGVDPTTNASVLITNELSQLKKDLLTAFTEGLKVSPKVMPASTGKSPAKSFKKPFWGPKTTPAPDPTQTRIDLLSDIFDKLTEVQISLLTGKDASPTVAAAAPEPSTIVPPSFWAPDPTAPDISAYYKDKTQLFLSQLFSGSTTEEP